MRQVIELDTLAIQLGERTGLNGLRRQPGMMHDGHGVLGRVAALQRQLQVACHLATEDAGHDRRPARVQLDQQVDAAATQRGGLDHLRAVGGGHARRGQRPDAERHTRQHFNLRPGIAQTLQHGFAQHAVAWHGKHDVSPPSSSSRGDRGLNLGERVGLVVERVEAVELNS